MKRLVNNLKKKALSDKDILRLCDGKVNVYTYDELNNYDHLDDILEPWGACIILYESKPDFGHWIALIKIDNTDIVEHFDSYAFKPDEELLLIPEYFRKESGQTKPHLSYLLYNSKYRISYNQYRLQKLENNVNTCGRYASFRVIMKDLPLEKFIDIFRKSKIDSDSLVSLLTGFI